MIEINPMAEDSTGKGRVKYLIMTSQSLVAHNELIRLHVSVRMRFVFFRVLETTIFFANY